jgi:WD40 repeat protein
LYEDWGGPLSSYDLETRRADLIEEHVANGPQAVSWDGRFFAYITTNRQVKVGDAATRQIRFTVQPPEWNLGIDLQFSPDSRLLAVAGSSGWIQVFDVGTGQRVSEPLMGYLAETQKVSFSADSKSLVTYSIDYTAKLWHIATSREMVSGLPLNSFLTLHWYWMLLPRDGNSVVEGADPGAIRVVRLPTLTQIDSLEKAKIKRP